MPHCVIEYSAPLGPALGTSAIMSAVFQGTLKSELFVAGDIKCRAQHFDDYCVGPERSDFIHVTIYLLKGRSIALKKHIADGVMNELLALDIPSCSFTVDFRELADAYTKHVR